MGKIGDLFVRLGVKSDDFKNGISEAQEQTEGFGQKLGKLKLAGVAVWTAISAAVAKFAKDAVALTQRWGDSWSITMTGVQSAYTSFVRQLSSGEGWDNLFRNMAEAYRNGKEVASVLDEIFERKVSYSYTEAETLKYISEQQLIMRDASKTDAERMKAAQNILAAEEKLAAVKQGIYDDEAAAMRKDFMSQTGLNPEQTDFLLKNYNENRDIINQAREYNAQMAKLRQAQTFSQIGGQFGNGYSSTGVTNAGKAMADLDAATSQTIKDIAKLVILYDKSNDDLVNGMANAEIAAINVGTEINRMKLRPTAALGTLTKDLPDTTAEVASNFAAAFENAERLADLKFEFQAEQLAIINEELEAEQENIQALLDETQEGINAQLTPQLTELGDVLSETLAAATKGLADAIQEMTDQIMGLEDVNMGAIASALLKPLCELAKQMGEIMMAAGTAFFALDSTLLNPTNPASALALIGAGAALVAIGSFASSALSALGKGGGSTSTSTSSTSTAASGTSTSELVVRVEGTIKGSDIIISGQKTSAAWAR